MSRSWSGRDWACALMRVNCAALLLLSQYTVGKAMAEGGQVIIQNDSFIEGQEVAYPSGFREQDIGAAVFELPEGIDAFRIDGIQIFWSSAETAFDTFVNIHLYQGAMPDPGTPVATLPGVGMSATVLNQAEPAGHPVGSVDQRAVAHGQQLNAALNDRRGCRILLVPHSVAVAEDMMVASFLLGLPQGTELIFIDDFYVGPGYGASTTSLLLFSQADHVARRGTGATHEDMQEELVDFRNRHNAQNFVKHFRHGPFEGRPVNP